MTWEIVFVFLIVAVALVLFVSERYSIDQVALGIPVVLLLAGIITPAEAVSGFSNTATITVAAMLILGLGLVKTGVIAAVARWALTARLGPPQMRMAILCLVVAGTSPFLNNTAVVVVFLPVFLSLAYQEGEAPSRYLMPLSFAAILGGTVTLVGTSTNLVIYGIAQDHGLSGLSMFSIAPLGLLYLAVGMVYLLVTGSWLIPRRMGAADLSGKYQVRQFLAELAVQPGAPAIGKPLGELKWREVYGVSIIGLGRGDRSVWAPGPERRVVEGDILYAQGSPQQLLSLARSEKLSPPARRAKSAIDFISENARLMEVMIGPHCPLAGHSLAEVRFQQRYNATVLAIQRHSVTIRDHLESLKLYLGDLLLVHGPVSALNSLADEPGFVPLRMVEAPVRHRPRALVAVGILVGVVALATSKLLPIMPAAMLGVVLMLFTRCVRLDEIYKELDWMVVFLLAGLLPLGIAMESTGAAGWLVSTVTSNLGVIAPGTIIAGFFVLTALLTAVMSNAATAVVVAPLALYAAAQLGLNPYALLVTVMFGSSASFMTPIGYQTNLLIYGPGGYRFSDFLKVGTPLTILLAILTTLVVPIFWPS
jgi:di/tricarboxylate transporter